MSEPAESSKVQDEVPRLQKLFDRPFLLLFLGMITMLAFYTLWGIFEIMVLTKAPLP